VKASDIIKLIRSTDDERSIKLIEDVFNFGYVCGISKGYNNIANLMKKDTLNSDLDEAKRLWLKNFL
jgi:hypothetical protein